jgi:hypothetical protein
MMPRQANLFLSVRYTWGTDVEHGFHGVYLGDLERLQDIQLKRDATNRNWQRIILYSIAKSLHNDSAGVKDVETAPEGESGRAFPKGLNRKFVFETRQLWWKLNDKMQIPEYANMLL